MIKITDLNDLEKYFNLPEGTVDFLKTMTAKTENGTYPFGEYCFIKVMDANMTKPSGVMEAHEIYVDVQCLITGEERIYYRERDGLKIKTEYSENSDAVFFFYENSPFVDYKAGECIVLYPEDAHMPCCAVNDDIKAKKAVVKINCEKLKK